MTKTAKGDIEKLTPQRSAPQVAGYSGLGGQMLSEWVAEYPGMRSQIATTPQDFGVLRPICHPISFLRKLVATSSVEFMRHSSVQIRGGAPDYQNYLCSCNNVDERELRFDAIAKHQLQAIREIAASRDWLDFLRYGWLRAALLDAQHQSATVRVGECYGFFKDGVLCTISNLILAVRPRIWRFAACWKGLLKFNLFPFRNRRLNQRLDVVDVDLVEWL